MNSEQTKKDKLDVSNSTTKENWANDKWVWSRKYRDRYD